MWSGGIWKGFGEERLKLFGRLWRFEWGWWAVRGGGGGEVDE